MLGGREDPGPAVFLRGTGLAIALAIGLAAAPGVAGATPRAIGATAPTMEAVGTTPAPVTGSHYGGALAGDSPLHLTVVLAPRDEAALTSFVDAVSTPGSPDYGRYLAPGQFGPRFGASPATIAAVGGALRAAGLQTGPPSSNGLTIPVTADAARVGAALHVGFARYSLPGGRAAFANTSRPLLPAAVSGAVRDIVGLQTLSRPAALDRSTPIEATTAPGSGAAALDAPLVPSPQALPDAAGPAPCAAASGAAKATAEPSYTIDQIAEGYDLDAFYADADLGAGTTVGIYELEPNLQSDITTFETCFGASVPVDYIPVDGGAGTGAGSGEAAIDIESVIGTAPQSRIEVFAGPDSGSGPLDTYVAMADQDTSQVNTTSWGLCEQDTLLGDPNAIADETPVFQQMVAQGQTLFAATGDDGSEGCTGDNGTRSGNALAVNDPASQPQVTGVGGTSLVATYSSQGRPTSIDPTPLATPPFQTVWNESGEGAGAGGGGISIAHVMPSYQSGAPAGLNVVNANSSGAPCGAPAGSDCREVPDVSSSADPNAGVEIYCTDDGTPGTLCESRWEAVGGTSAAAPFWAAMMALINSDPADGCAVPATFGLVNPLLYAIAAAPNHASALTDVKPAGTLGAPSSNDDQNRHGGLYPVGVGYDMATGLGTPLAGGPDGLAAQLCAMRAPVDQVPTLSTLSPDSGPAAAGTAVTIDGAFFLPGASVAVGGAPATDVQVLSFNQITAVLPAGSGPENVTVSTSRGVSGPLTYTYPTPAPPPAPAGPTTPTTPTSPTSPTKSPTSTTPTTPATPTTPVGATPPTTGKTAARSGPVAGQLLLTCSKAKLAITDLVVDGAEVSITGAGPASLAGRKVKILFGAKHSQVASATLGSGGLFRASAPLVAAALRTGPTAPRYVATIGSLESAGLSLSRRLVLDPPEETDGRITLTGEVVGPLAQPAAAIVVRQATSCSAGTQVASIRPSASGRFTVRLSVPVGVRAALYRLGTRVRQSTRVRSTIATGSLLEAAALS
jgi:hypothetical protein